MSTITMPRTRVLEVAPPALKRRRIESIDVLRGTVMIIMAIDHVRDYFHADAFVFDPTDLSKTSVFLFFTRFITHYCAPVFVFLAGVSAYLSGTRKTKRALANFLLTRGLWLVLVELVIMEFGRTFNPSFHYFNLQVIWAIGVSMIALSGLIFLRRRYMLMIGLMLVAGHNLLDHVHVAGNGAGAFIWALLHEKSDFYYGSLHIFVHYPLLPWIGIMTLGYCIGPLFGNSFRPETRKEILLLLGSFVTAAFFLLRLSDTYGDLAPWSPQKNLLYTLMSILNVTKYPPSLLYTMVTLGPAMIFLALAEKPLKKFSRKLAVFGRVPMFYYIVHIYLIHALAMIAAVLSGHAFSDMILSTKLVRSTQLKGYGFSLPVVYLVWFALILMLYPMCKWFDRYKQRHLQAKPWLSYL
jgi:uncharacterized membrane protein